MTECNNDCKMSSCTLAHAPLTLYVYMYIQKSKIPGDIIYRKKHTHSNTLLLATLYLPEVVKCYSGMLRQYLRPQSLSVLYLARGVSGMHNLCNYINRLRNSATIRQRLSTLVNLLPLKSPLKCFPMQVTPIKNLAPQLRLCATLCVHHSLQKSKVSTYTMYMYMYC